jgi:MFS family permease
VIFYKEMEVGPLAIVLMIALKPMSAVLAPYWSQAISNRPDRILPNLIWANVLRYLPFLFVPWIESPIIIVAIFALYMALYRGVIPAWMETIKRNVPAFESERLVARGSTIDFCGAGVLPFLLGFILDQYEYSWRWLFPITALVGLSSTLLLLWIPKPAVPSSLKPIMGNLAAFREKLMWPWVSAWKLMKENKGFAHFQVGFMLAASGIMMMQPAIPAFFVDTLNLSYTSMLFALAACKGIAFAVTSPFWVKLFRKVTISPFCGLVTLLAALFPFLLISAQYHVGFVYLAYLLYGIMQAGSELGWHMSGPVFAQHEESIVFSSTNVCMVGIRGCFAPALGAFFLPYIGATGVMLLCSLLCFLATQHFFFARVKVKAEQPT